VTSTSARASAARRSSSCRRASSARGGLDFVPQLVDAAAELAALGGVDLLEARLERPHDAALAAHPLDAQRLPCRAVRDRVDLAPKARQQRGSSPVAERCSVP
jgi:hypothetical protein